MILSDRIIKTDVCIARPSILKNAPIQTIPIIPRTPTIPTAVISFLTEYLITKKNRSLWLKERVRISDNDSERICII